MAEQARDKAKRSFALIVAVILVVLFLASIAMSGWIGREAASVVNRVANEGWYGQVVFVSLFTIVCLTGVVPASVLVIAAGTIYGFNKGALLSAVGLSIGGIAGFAGARFLFREIARPWVSSRIALRKIDADIALQGWKVVALLRLSPIAPFGLTSYALGLTRLRFADYLIGSFGSMPAMAAYAYMGALAHEALYVSSGAVIPMVRLGVTGLGVAATFAASIHFYRLLSRANKD